MSDLTERIGRANGFELGSLPANQRGEKTPEQNGLLFPKLIGPLLVLFISFFVLYFQLNQQGVLKKIFNSVDLVKVVMEIPIGTKVMGGILIAVSIWLLVVIIQLILDIMDRSVKQIEGPGYRKVTSSTDQDGSKTTRFYYVINGKKFPVKKAGFAIFEDGALYRAFYSPRRKVLLNIESLE